jgi:hypothetical protein
LGVHFDPARRKYVVRWMQDGRRRTRRFDHEDAAARFFAALQLGGWPSQHLDLGGRADSERQSP